MEIGIGGSGKIGCEQLDSTIHLIAQPLTTEFYRCFKLCPFNQEFSLG
ncbi:hypothetical protein NKI41_31535 [Mesorhizobium sp. M0601]